MDIRQLIYQLLSDRGKILLGIFTVDEMKELKQKITHTIDKGNK